MNCTDVRAHWDLFHDSEGDAKLHLQINEHLALCPECARWFYEQSRLEDALAEKLRSGDATQEVWSRIREACAAPEPAARRNWSFLRGLFAVAACALVAVGLATWLIFGRGAGAGSRDLADLSVGLHEKLATGKESVKLSSRSNLEIEDYLRRHVSFPVRCPPRGDAGFEVEGGGVCNFDASPVAYVVGHVDGQRVSIFILSAGSLPSFPAQNEALRRQATWSDRQSGLDIVMGKIDQNIVLVVGPNGAARLEGVLSAYGSYHEHGAEQTPALQHESPTGANLHPETSLSTALGRCVGSPIGQPIAEGTVSGRVA